MFKIPIIKVKSRDESGRPHIVGTDSHDSLYIDEHSGGIHYFNIQGCESTQRFFKDGKELEYCYDFQGKEGYIHNAEIEFVTPEQLFEIIIETVQMQTDQKIKMLEFHRKYFDAIEEEDEKLKEAEKKYNAKILW